MPVGSRLQVPELVEAGAGDAHLRRGGARGVGHRAQQVAPSVLHLMHSADTAVSVVADYAVVHYNLGMDSTFAGPSSLRDVQDCEADMMLKKNGTKK